VRILLVSDVYSPEVSGGAIFVELLGQQLQKRGHIVTICTTAVPDYSADNELMVYRLRGLFSRLSFLYKGPHPPLSDPVVVKRLRNIIEKEKPDIVHAFGWIVQSVIPALKKADVPLIITLLDYRAICPVTGASTNSLTCGLLLNRHCITCSRQLYGTGLAGTGKSLAACLAIWANRRKLRHIDAFIAISSYVQRVHEVALNLSDKDMVVIPLFVRDKSDRVEIDTKLPGDYILFVGRFAPEKGIDVLVQAYRKLNTAAKLVLVVDRYPASYYQGINGLYILENPSVDVIARAYQNCRFAVFPSIWAEPLGMVVLEAMSCSKAVIASNAGGFTDVIVNNRTGILVEPNDVEGLYRSMKNLLNNPETADRMGNNGYKRWKQLFHSDVTLDKIEALYTSCLQKSYQT
jgi:glycosyltransferase involved in cell wall biosynthesis